MRHHRRPTRHPVTERLDFTDHRAMAAWWGKEARRAIDAAVRNPHPTTVWDLELLQAVRAAKMAWWHALTATGWREWGRETQLNQERG